MYINLRILCFYFKRDIKKVNAKFSEDLSPLEVVKRTRMAKNMACLTLTGYIYLPKSQVYLADKNIMPKFISKSIFVYYPDQENFISNFISPCQFTK